MKPIIHFDKNSIEEILEAIVQHELLAKKLITKVIDETGQKNIAQLKVGEHGFIEQTDTDQLSDNWIYNVHGEHCDFTNHIDGRTLTACLGDKESIDYLDPYFFYCFLKNNPKYAHLAQELKPGFRKVYDLFEQLTNLKLMKKVDRFGPAFIRIKYNHKISNT